MAFERPRRIAARAAGWVGAFSLGALSATTLGALAAPRLPKPPPTLLADVLTNIQNLFYEDIDPATVVYAGARGMTSVLDPYSQFIDPEQRRRLEIESDSTASFGLGLELARHNGTIVVLSAMATSPAARAGVRSGDVVLGIDQFDARHASLAEASARLRGPVGAQVTLRIGRPGRREPLEVLLQRESIDVSRIEARLIDGRIGHVRIHQFQKGTDDRVKNAIDQLRAQAGPPFRGVVLDLRDNPGGLIEEGIAVADRFLARGKIVMAEGRRGLHKETWSAKEKGTEPNYPLAVLVNAGTASASEVLAAALQDQGRAYVFGLPTFGKASVQDLIEFDDGSILKITKARYFTPLGQAIHGRGILPDVLVPLADQKVPDVKPDGTGTGRAPVDGAKLRLTTQAKDTLEDPQLRAAAEALLQWSAFEKSLRELRGGK